MQTDEYHEVNQSFCKELVTCEDSLRQKVVFVLTKDSIEVIKAKVLVSTSNDKVNCWRYDDHKDCVEQALKWGYSTKAVLED